MLKFFSQKLIRAIQILEREKSSDRFAMIMVLPNGGLEVDREAFHQSESYKQQVEALKVLVNNRNNKTV